MNSKEKIVEVMKKHNLMSIATVDENQMPKVRSVDYAMGEDESTLYFITHKFTDKVGEIKANPNVYISIDEDGKSMEELSKMMYLKASGKAYIAETEEEMGKIFGAIMTKFPHLKDLPGEPTDFLGIKVELDTVKLTDNNVSFGHTEEVSYR
ncbi:pyridoxamine 5'-phosphate oxidase family protein [Anaeromicrobium sediminis]|uniref:Pyridoxamine 5'-phosphate oxidase N-terminal domain-containing protein n=1 Tax=Anaeromicrobium sediminis TaxID=1478221 RepID=A0A267MLY8_9FIRM|nr:pyridoxamine 5'-phosphate oxidase family protein [Anaeromicrobium sediminis]PAB59823.1 hypothetical protein CCE28_07660 [Anaeromicrobium sediminis]